MAATSATSSARPAATPAASATSSGRSSAGPRPGRRPAAPGAGPGADRPRPIRAARSTTSWPASDWAARPTAADAPRPPPNGSNRPRSIEAEVELSLEEAYHGTSRLVQVDGKRLEVTVPRGVETGSRIRLKGRGGGDPSHPADLYLVTRVQHHPVYTRLGADLSREVPIALGEALLGAEIPVTTLKGRIRLTIPPETQTGRTFRLKGQGMPRLKPKSGEAPTGDLLIKVKVVLPTGLSDDARVAARRLVELTAQPDPRGTDGGAT